MGDDQGSVTPGGVVRLLSCPGTPEWMKTGRTPRLLGWGWVISSQCRNDQCNLDMLAVEKKQYIGLERRDRDSVRAGREQSISELGKWGRQVPLLSY